jgi:hypothetical protein
MKRVILIAFTLAVVALSFAMTAVAGNPHCPPIIPTDICANCANPGQGGGEDLVCVCKSTDNFGGTFKSQGECMKFLRSIM